MKYEANPVIVDAFKIMYVQTDVERPNYFELTLEDGRHVLATPEMTIRMPLPMPGDYWVVQSDGYIYLNPKAVFERKYSPVLQARSA